MPLAIFSVMMAAAVVVWRRRYHGIRIGDPA
jgi:hypothetical protein